MAADHSITNGDAGSVDSFSTVNSIDVSAYTVGGGDQGRTETGLFESGLGQAGLGQTGTIEIEIPSRVDLVAVVRMIVAAATSAVDAIHGDRLDDLRWVTSEATTNAIEANMARDHGGRVVVTCEVADGLVRLAVSDQGQGMAEPPDIPDIADPERLLVEGAFGIPLMQHLSSALSFHTGHDGTTVEMELHQ